MIIAVDFDDTIATCPNWPEIGEINLHAVEVLKKMKKYHVLILWTCRSGELLQKAIDSLKELGLEFDYINDNPLMASSRKICADVYIDDRAFGGILNWEAIENTFCKEKE